MTSEIDFLYLVIKELQNDIKAKTDKYDEIIRHLQPFNVKQKKVKLQIQRNLGNTEVRPKILNFYTIERRTSDLLKKVDSLSVEQSKTSLINSSSVNQLRKEVQFLREEHDDIRRNTEL